MSSPQRHSSSRRRYGCTTSSISYRDFRTKTPRIAWSGHHTQSLTFGRPLLVLDMYEHSYAIDYGAAAAKYVDAFFDNVQWDVVNDRYEEVA